MDTIECPYCKGKIRTVTVDWKPSCSHCGKPLNYSTVTKYRVISGLRKE